MKKMLIILTILLPATLFAGILEWGFKAPVKGKVKSIKYYMISLYDSARCCSNPERILYFDTAGLVVSQDFFFFGKEKWATTYEYDSKRRLTKKTEKSWITYFYYNDSAAGNNLLSKTIRYAHERTVPTESIVYTYEGSVLKQYKSYSELGENYTCTVTDSNGAKIESYRRNGMLTDRDETRYYADGLIAMTNSYSKYQIDEESSYVVEQYSYAKYDKNGNWTWCKAIGNRWGKPVYWLFVRDIEYYE